MNQSEQDAYDKLKKRTLQWYRIAAERTEKLHRLYALATLALRSENPHDWRLALEAIAERTTPLNDTLDGSGNQNAGKATMVITDLNHYQRLAEQTINSNLAGTDSFAVAALGLVGEAGEIGEMVKKWIGQGHTLDLDKVTEELGDVLWYVSYMATLIQEPLSVVASNNIDKLRKRYNGGAFDPNLSINRTHGLAHASDETAGVWVSDMDNG